MSYESRRNFQEDMDEAYRSLNMKTRDLNRALALAPFAKAVVEAKRQAPEGTRLRDAIASLEQCLNDLCNYFGREW